MEEIKNLKVAIDVCVTQSDIDDIMCAALEGGITYWCNRAEVVGEYLGEYASEQISRGGELKLYDAETEEAFVLTEEKFLAGLKMFIEDGRSEVVLQGCLDVGEIDGADADAIVQLALFGEIVYG